MDFLSLIILMVMAVGFLIMIYILIIVIAFLMMIFIMAELTKFVEKKDSLQIFCDNGSIVVLNGGGP